jgi:glyoxylase-like metal-dependent hydrolase (beta-lactamase superfamily II)
MIRKVLIALGSIFALLAAALLVVIFFPQVLPPSVPNPWAALAVKPLRGGAYWVQGGISNTGFIIGDKGVIVIDAQFFAVTAQHELQQLAKLTSLPVNAIILTHSDPDHVNSLPAFPRGTPIFAHENTKADMLAALSDPHIRWISRPTPEMKNYLPTQLVRDRLELDVDGVHLVLLHFAPAHTNGDVIVYLPALKLVYAGDLLTPEVGPYPGIHAEKHGNSAGWIETVRGMLALDADLFVAGHGELQTREQVQVRLQAAQQRRAMIQSMAAAHKSLAEVKAAFADPPLTGIASRFPTFTDTTYAEFTGTHDSP